MDKTRLRHKSRITELLKTKKKKKKKKKNKEITVALHRKFNSLNESKIIDENIFWKIVKLILSDVVNF